VLLLLARLLMLGVEDGLLEERTERALCGEEMVCRGRGQELSDAGVASLQHIRSKMSVKMYHLYRDNKPSGPASPRPETKARCFSSEKGKGV
jgi:hypothetical protein